MIITKFSNFKKKSEKLGCCMIVKRRLLLLFAEQLYILYT